MWKEHEFVKLMDTYQHAWFVSFCSAQTGSHGLLSVRQVLYRWAAAHSSSSVHKQSEADNHPKILLASIPQHLTDCACFHAAKDHSPPHVLPQALPGIFFRAAMFKTQCGHSQRVALTCILLHSGSCLVLHKPRRSCDRCGKHNTTPITLKWAQHNAETHWNSLGLNPNSR